MENNSYSQTWATFLIVLGPYFARLSRTSGKGDPKRLTLKVAIFRIEINAQNRAQARPSGNG